VKPEKKKKERKKLRLIVLSSWPMVSSTQRKKLQMRKNAFLKQKIKRCFVNVAASAKQAVITYLRPVIHGLLLNI
jgi:predicted RNA polymerase sigma factor